MNDKADSDSNTNMNEGQEEIEYYDEEEYYSSAQTSNVVTTQQSYRVDQTFI